MPSVIYLDNHASTKCDPDVITAMLPFMTDEYANPSGTSRAAKGVASAIESSRESVAELIGANAEDIHFTSGATEANNLMILGFDAELSGRGNVVSTRIEHKSVKEPISQLCRQGLDIRWLTVEQDGSVGCDLNQIDEQTAFVSVQFASNEIGTIQDIRRIAERCQQVGAMFHCDATQAAGRIPIDVETDGIDFLTLSGHKMHGPKGSGILYCSKRKRSFLRPIMAGGGQERQLRPGTLNTPAIVGLGVAASLSRRNLPTESVSLSRMRDEFETELAKLIPGVRYLGNVRQRLPNNSSVVFPGADAELLLASTTGLTASTGSACTQGAYEPSYVLSEIGLSREQAYSTVRFGFSRFNTTEDAKEAAALLAAAYQLVAGIG